jgi:Domain of unknown function (DUF4157)
MTERERQQKDPGRARAERAGRLVARNGAGLMAGGRVHPEVETRINRARGSGAGLGSGTRARIEPLLGDSFADVRVHDGPAADALAGSVAARAFTTGRDLFFARGEYRPGTSGGENLLAHELAHVVQQRGAPVSGPLSVTEPDGQLEREADEIAKRQADVP